MKIYQLTDLHLTLNPNDDTYGHDVKLHFDSAMEYIQKNPANLLVITGDLCLDTGNRETYQYIKQTLESTGIPYILLPGNHDDTEMMLQCFGPERCVEKVSLHALNEHFEALYINSGSGVVNDSLLAEITGKLKRAGLPVVVFIHHPVLPVDVPYMEINYALKNREVLQGALKEHTKRCFLFCGHYHVDITTVDEQVIQQVTPALFFQIKPSETLFTPDNLPPAFRELVLQGNTLHTRVVTVRPKNAT